MDQKPLIIVNCRSQETLRNELQTSLRLQNIKFELQIIESNRCPSRLGQITDEDKIYFFFDEDIELPKPDYLKNILDIFSKNSDLLFLGGKYLSDSSQSYLAKSYNSQIELWMSAPDPNQMLTICQNIPGGVWIISGKIKKYLVDWLEPIDWAGEDTFSIRWLQKKGVKTYYHMAADVFHFPRTPFFYFCQRAFLQGYAREKLFLKTKYQKINWNFIWNHKIFWAGWGLHQFFVEVGCLSFKIKSFKPKITPNISPTV